MLKRVIKTIRKVNYESKREFANKLGISAGLVSKIENGQSNITTSLINIISRKYNISINDINEIAIKIKNKNYDDLELQLLILEKYKKYGLTDKQIDVEKYISQKIKNKKNIENELNVGAPIYEYISLDMNKIVSLSNDSRMVKNNFDKINNSINSIIKEITGTIKLDCNFVTRLKYKADSVDSITKLYIDINSVYENIFKYINIDYKNLTDLSIVNHQLDELKNVKNTSELKNKFPLIYEDYIKGQEIYKNTEYILNHFKEDSKEYKNALFLRRKCDACQLKINFFEFVNNQYNMYKNIILNIKNLQQYARKPLSYDILEGVDISRLKLYIASKYLNQASNNQQKALYYLIPYIRENYDNVSIIDDTDNFVNYEYIKSGVKKIVTNNRTLIPYDTTRKKFAGKTEERSLNIIEDDLSYYPKLQWSTNSPEKYRNNKRNNKLGTVKKYKNFSNDDKNYAKKIYNRKINLLEKSPYMTRLFGKNGFDGYVAYIYRNGNVLMEKFYKDYKNLDLAVSEAMYVLDIDNFEKYCNLPKKQLMNLSKDKCVRIYHSDSYEQKASVFINQQIEETKKEKVKEFVKKLNQF